MMARISTAPSGRGAMTPRAVAVGNRQLAVEDELAHGGVDILQVHVGDAAPDLFHVGQRVLVPEGVVAGIEAEVDIGVLQQQVDLPLELARRCRYGGGSWP